MRRDWIPLWFSKTSMLSSHHSLFHRRHRLNFRGQRLYICTSLWADVWDIHNWTHVGKGNVSIPISHSIPKGWKWGHHLPSYFRWDVWAIAAAIDIIIRQCSCGDICPKSQDTSLDWEPPTAGHELMSRGRLEEQRVPMDVFDISNKVSAMLYMCPQSQSEFQC